MAEGATPPLYLNAHTCNPVKLSVVDQHKWLGILWSSNLNLTAALNARLGLAAGLFSSIAGLVTNGVPLPVVLRLFESKVDGTLRFGRWLLATAPTALERFNEVYNSWARVLIGADRWRNSAVASGELGWSLSGAGIAVVDVAMQRARLWSLDDSDLYKQVFVNSHKFAVSWASASQSVVESWSIPDLPQVTGRSGLDGYKAMVRESESASCIAEWRGRA